MEESYARDDSLHLASHLLPLYHTTDQLKAGESIMNTFLLRADDVLRGRLHTSRAVDTGQTLQHLIVCIVLFGVIYGGVMGSYGGASGYRVWQMLASAIKVPLLLLVTFGLSLPPYFVLNTLSGLRDDFAEALRALMATQAGLAVILAALAPFTLLWYASSSTYQSAILFNAAMFAIASVSSQRLLRRYYGPLIARNERHRRLLRLWLVLYGFVGIQMGWILRPFIGDPASPATFLRAESWGNAYVVLSRLIWNVIAP